jgi:hypothetical protein
MRRIVLAVVFLSLATAAPLLGQAQSGHVYAIRYHQVHQGQDSAYNAVYADILRPVFDEAVRRGVIVSYLDLTQISGTGKTTHIIITEYSNWAALDEAFVKLDEASQAVFGRPLDEMLADLPEIRDYLLTEYYMSIVP